MTCDKKVMLTVPFIFLVYIGLLTGRGNAIKRPAQIFTADGALKIQSASNKNVSFVVDDSSDVLFGTLSIKELQQKVQSQDTAIEQLKKQQSLSACPDQNHCQNRGQCLLEKSDIRLCICHPGYTGKRCEIRVHTTACSGTDCGANGHCIVENSNAMCKCNSKWFGKQCEFLIPEPCSYNLESSSGFIESPGYPNGYPINSNCSWRIKVSTEKVIKLMVKSVQLGENCKSGSFLEVKDVLTHYHLITRLCGIQSSQVYFTLTNEALITLESSPSTFNRWGGFSIYYEAADAICGGKITDNLGTINSPPETLSKGYCVWLFSNTFEEKFDLDVIDLKLINPPGSCRDNLVIKTENGLVETFCKNQPRTKISVVGKKIEIKLASHSPQSSFKLNYKLACGGNVNFEDGSRLTTIQSPNYPNAYKSKTSCIWNVRGMSSDNHLVMRFIDFEMEPHPSCTDYVSIYSNADAKGERVKKYCGDTVALPVSVTGNQMSMLFVTDGTGHFKGFDSEIEEVIQGCGGVFSGKNGIISSPTGGIYPNDISCAFTIVADGEDHLVQLRFTYFNLSTKTNSSCQDESVQIYDSSGWHHGMFPSTVDNDGKFCGMDSPPVILSTSRSLTIVFKTRKIESRRFTADWKALPKPKGCDVYMADEEGAISSPGYPDNYSPNLECKYTIYSREGHLIQLSFDTFNLTDSTECSSESLRIYDGDSVINRLLGTFCGNKNPGNITSNGNVLHIIFKTSPRASFKNGFHAKYITGTDVCGGHLYTETGIIRTPNFPQAYPTNLDCEWQLKGKLGYFYDIYLVSVNLPKSEICSDADYLTIYDGNQIGDPILAQICERLPIYTYYSSSRNEAKIRLITDSIGTDNSTLSPAFSMMYFQACGGNFRELSGVITSLNYPKAYQGTTCTYRIEGRGNDIVKLTVNDVDLSSDCRRASVTIREGFNSLGRYCNESSSSMIRSEGNTVSIVVRSQGEGSGVFGRGFNISYIIEGCSADLSNTSGSFETPNYPRNYPANSYCRWRIRVAERNRIQLNLSAISLESECKNDNVTIYNGYTSYDLMIGRYCSERKPISLVSSSNEMLVLFRSNAGESGKGFSASYKEIKGGCGGTYKSHEGRIHSPGYPTNIPAYTECIWKIIQPENATVKITFNSSELSDDATCSHSSNTYVEIKDSKEDRVLGIYCRSEETVVSASNEVTVKFINKEPSSKKGMQLYFKMGCGGEKIVASDGTIGTITSPYYPNMYGKEDCVWDLRADSSEDRIELSFTDFDIEYDDDCSNDYLKVYKNTPFSNNTLIGSYCGQIIPPVITSTNDRLYIHFRSSSTKHRTGFKAHYSNVIGRCGGVITGYQGHIVSPLYPGTSPINQECIWTIKVSEGSIIQFTFTEYDIGFDAYTQLYDGENVNAPFLQRGTGNTIPSSLTSTTSQLTFKYVAGSKSKGFKASFRTDCTRTLTTIHGVLESPNYPGLYPASTICNWRLVGPTDSSVEVQFEDFHLEEAVNFFCDDYVNVYEGFFVRIGVYCGSTLPSAFSSSGNTLSIAFSSDSTTEQTGFRLKYSFSVKKCGAALTATSQDQYITSPNYPENYDNNADCSWEMSGAVGSIIKFTIVDINLENYFGSFCYDTLELYSHNPPQTEERITRLCATPTSSIFRTSGSKAIVKFTSDATVTRRGFNISYKLACGGLFTSVKDSIELPTTASGNYTNNENCKWPIKVQPGAVIKITFSRLDLERSVNCSKDYVLIRNGALDDSPVIGRYCGTNNTINITTNSNEARVDFVSDGSNTGEGFELMYEQYKEACGGEQLLEDPNIVAELTSPKFPEAYPNHQDCEWKLKVPEGHIVEFSFTVFNISSSFTCGDDYVELSNFPNGRGSIGKFCGNNIPQNQSYRSSGDEFYVRFRSTAVSNERNSGFKALWKIGCGGHFYAADGIIRSPLYPNSYKNNSDCLYSIEIPSKKQVHLGFNKFDLYKTNGTCNEQGDYVEVSYDDAHVIETQNKTIKSQSRTLIGRYCGSQGSHISITSPNNKTYIRFVTDANYTSTGFEITFNSVGQECGDDLRSSGTVLSPNYPNPYPFNRMCWWYLQSQFSELTVELTFHTLDIEETDNCTNDYVAVYNGRLEKTLIKKYCGKLSNLAPVVSSENYLTILFVSDKNIERGGGFNASFRTSPQKNCGGILSGTSGNISSPNYPRFYPRSALCEWTITVNTNKTIEIVINDFILESSSTCQFDYLQIRDGQNAWSDSLGKFCGTRISAGHKLLSTGNDMHITFKSDGSVQRRGFSLTWTEKDFVCGGVIQQESGFVKSPGYPNVAAAISTNCFWRIEASEGSRIKVTVEDLQLTSSNNCSNMALTLINGNLPDSPTLDKLCGNKTKNQTLIYYTSSNHLGIHFMANDLQSIFKGYHLRYTSVTTGCGGIINADEGNITSPNYPNKYDQNLDCEWRIITRPGSRVLVYIDELDIVDRLRCAREKLELKDGNSNAAPTLGTLCSKTHKSVYEASGNMILIRFVSWTYSFAARGTGFRIHFNIGCGGILRGISGFAKTPGFPNPYPNNQNCQWRIDTEPYFHTQLTAATFDLPPRNSSNLCKDYVRALNGLNLSSPLLAEFCGQTTLPSYTLPSHQLLLHFVSDNVTDRKPNNELYTGVSASYRTVCGENITTSSPGSIHMPYGDDYHNNQTCIWIIEFPAGKQITVDIRRLSLEAGTLSCLYDYLEIRDGKDENAPLFGRFCGTSRPPKFHSSSNFVFIKFVSDEAYTRDGFVLEYMEGPPVCGGRYNQSTGVITTPDYPNTYPLQVSCGWSITVKEGKQVNLTFEAFSLPQARIIYNNWRDCDTYIDIYDRSYPDDAYRITGIPICGTSIPGPYISFGNSMFIYFVSSNQDTFNRTGFNATYRTVTRECGGKKIAGKSTTVMSYPADSGTFENGTACQWVLEAPEGREVILKITKLNLPPPFENGTCPATQLIVVDGILSRFGQPIHRLCGNRSFTMRSSSHLLRLILIRANSSNQFQISYRSTPAVCMHTFNKSTGLITSPNHPLNYPQYTDCTYLITAKQDEKIYLFPEAFAIEAHSSCNYDSLSINDGGENSAPLQKSPFCGLDLFKDIPLYMSSTGNKLYLKFKTDFSVTHPGFAITYIASQEVCGGNLTAYKGALTTPNYPSGYGDNLSCTWNINVAHGMKINVNVTDFETEPPAEEASCSTTDYIEFQDIGESQSLGRFCGFNHIAPRMSNSNHVQIKFVSNSRGSNLYKGFRLTYREVY